MDATKMSRRRRPGALLEQTQTSEGGRHPPTSPYASASLVTLAGRVIGTDSVRRWRFEQLRRGGYPAGDALVLSARSDVDLHQATRLLRERCSVRTAMQILI